MNVSLTPKLEELIKEKVASGLYNSSSEVVREALRLLEERDRIKLLKIEELKAMIQEGEASGEPIPLDMQSIIQEGIKRHGK